MGRHRTPEEKVALKAQALELRSQGVKRADILTQLGIGDDLLNAFVSGAPLPDSLMRPQAKDEVRAIAVGLRQQGWSYNAIAKDLGVSKSSCSLWLRSVDESAAHADWPQDQQVAGDEPPTCLVARDLREQGWLVAEIADALGLPVAAVFRWTRDLPVPLRLGRGGNRDHMTMMREARWGQYRVDRDIAESAARCRAADEVGPVEDHTLLLLGAMAYWCEGSKSKPWRRQGSMVFVNSDPMLIKIFLRWCQLVGADRLRFGLQIHESADVDAALGFWSELVGVPVEQFLKTNLKRHNPKTVRYNTGDSYLGCLRVTVHRSAALLVRVEGLMQGIVRGAVDA